jgi:beta-galactosidase
VPEVASPIAIAPFKLTEAASLWDNLPKPLASDRPLAMEDIGQAYGWILYRTKLLPSEDGVGTLTFHDYARVYLDGKAPDLNAPTFKVDGQPSSVQSGFTADRRQGNTSIHAATSKQQQFDLLIENSGRINYSHQLLTDRKGVIHSDPPAQPLSWFIYSLPMTNPWTLPFKKADCSGPCFYRGTFTVDRLGDTFLDTSNLGKGQLWVNGHAMGRFWKIGPQKTLYVPGPWLKQGKNEVIVFDVDGHPSATLEGLTKPDLGQ